MANDKNNDGVPDSGNLKSGNAKDAADNKSAPGNEGASLGQGTSTSTPHGNTMGGSGSSAAGPKTTAPAQTKDAKASGEGQAQPPTTDEGRQGHQAALTQNNQQAIAGGHAESRVGATDPLQLRSLQEPSEGTKAHTVKSPNFSFNAQGPFQPGDVIHLNEDEAKRASAHVEVQGGADSKKSGADGKKSGAGDDKK